MDNSLSYKDMHRGFHCPHGPRAGAPERPRTACDQTKFLVLLDLRGLRTPLRQTPLGGHITQMVHQTRPLRELHTANPKSLVMGVLP